MIMELLALYGTLKLFEGRKYLPDEPIYTSRKATCDDTFYDTNLKLSVGLLPEDHINQASKMVSP